MALASVEVGSPLRASALPKITAPLRPADVEILGVLRPDERLQFLRNENARQRSIVEHQLYRATAVNLLAELKLQPSQEQVSALARVVLAINQRHATDWCDAGPFLDGLRAFSRAQAQAVLDVFTMGRSPKTERSSSKNMRARQLRRLQTAFRVDRDQARGLLQEVNGEVARSPINCCRLEPADAAPPERVRSTPAHLAPTFGLEPMPK